MINKEKSLLNILIDFFASIYDLAINIFQVLINFFASLYDYVYYFIIFLVEYVKWVTTLKPNNFDIHAEKPIQVRTQNSLEIR
jgi:phage-related protein